MCACVPPHVFVNACVCVFDVKPRVLCKIHSNKQLEEWKTASLDQMCSHRQCVSMCVYVCVLAWGSVRVCGVDCFMPGRTWKVERERESMPTHICRLQTGKAFCHSYGCEKIQTIECTHLLSVQTQRMQLHKHTWLWIEGFLVFSKAREVKVEDY